MVYKVTPETLALTKRYAYDASFGGYTPILTNRNMDMVRLSNWVGQIGEALAHFILFESLDSYVAHRDTLLGNRTGDGGTDVPGMRLDVKSSLRRNPKRDPSSYHLWVREDAIRDFAYYVQMVIDPNVGTTGLTEKKPTRAYCIGWCHTADFKVDMDDHGLRWEAKILRPIRELQMMVLANELGGVLVEQ